jgi:hypothetical protein
VFTRGFSQKFYNRVRPSFFLNPKIFAYFSIFRSFQNSKNHTNLKKMKMGILAKIKSLLVCAITMTLLATCYIAYGQGSLGLFRFAVVSLMKIDDDDVI